MDVTFNYETLTVGEAEDFESVTGVDLSETMAQLSAGAVNAKTLKAVAWIVGRRSNPDLTLENVRNMNILDLKGLGGEPSPKGDSPSAPLPLSPSPTRLGSAGSTT